MVSCIDAAPTSIIRHDNGIQRIFGYPTDEIVGNRVRTFTSIMCKDDVPAMDEVVGKALESRTDWTLEHRICRYVHR